MIIIVYISIFLISQVCTGHFSIALDYYAKNKKKDLISVKKLRKLFFKSKLFEEKTKIGKLSFYIQIFNLIFSMIYISLAVIFAFILTDGLWQRVWLILIMVYGAVFFMLLVTVGSNAEFNKEKNKKLY